MRSGRDSVCIVWSEKRGKMTEIYLAENHLLLKTGYGNPEMHSRSACHVLVDLRGDMCVITEKYREVLFYGNSFQKRRI